MANPFDATAVLQDNLHFAATTTNGFTVSLDGSGEHGPTPMETVLSALAGCTGMDVISILRKMRQEVTHYEVRVHGERAETHPKVYTEISVQHVVRGHGLVSESVARAVELSATRYCPVSAMLGGTVPVSHTYIIEQVVEAPAGD